LTTAVKRLAKTGQVVEVLVVSLNDDRPLLFRCLGTGATRHIRRSEMPPQAKKSIQTVNRRPRPASFQRAAKRLDTFNAVGVV
jgi:hypothetical protein